MKLLLRLLFLLPVLIILALACALFAAIQSTPLVSTTVKFTTERIADGKRILDANDPRNMYPGEVRIVSLTEEDLDLALNYFANHYGRGSASLSLQPGMAHVEFTTVAPHNPFGAYLNFKAELAQTSGLPHVARLRIGSLAIPGWLVDWALRHAVKSLCVNHDYRVLAEVVKNVGIGDGRMNVTYEWQKEVDDSRSGSGFFFSDIAADRAGVLFGEKAIASPSSARKLQEFIGASVRESDFMPSTVGLPEFMHEAEFKRRFGGVGRPAYDNMMKEIERRVAALAING